MQIQDFIDSIFTIINEILLPLAFALCVAYFFWGIVKYLKDGATSPDAGKEGKRVMIYGLIGIFVAFSIFGIIELLRSEFGLPNIQNIKLPR